MLNEKMSILNLLQEGKISADEAARLLGALEGEPAKASPASKTARSNNGPAPKPSGPSAKSADDSVDFEELGRRFGAFAREMEPKIHKFTETVAEKTVSFADRLSRGIQEGLAAVEQPSEPAAPKKPSAPVGPAAEKIIELAVGPGPNELSLAGLNGNLCIKGYNGDKISARIICQPSPGRKGPAPELTKLGGRYYLAYDEDDFASVAIDAFVPERLFETIHIRGQNASMDVSSLTCTQLQITHQNGNLRVGQIVAETALIEHMNGPAKASEIDAAKFSLTNFNGPVSLDVAAFARFADYLWNVETSNARLTLNLPTLLDVGYHLKAEAALGTIRLGLTGLAYLVNDPHQVEARSADFDHRAKKVRLALETSNAQLTVN